SISATAHGWHGSRFGTLAPTSTWKTAPTSPATGTHSAPCACWAGILSVILALCPHQPTRRQRPQPPTMRRRTSTTIRPIRSGNASVEERSNGSVWIEACASSTCAAAAVLPRFPRLRSSGQRERSSASIWQKTCSRRPRQKALARGLQNIEFRVGDMLDLDIPDSELDVVVCVFGIFFVPDMPAAVHELWRLVRPGGKLAITTWGPRFFEPATTAFWNSV